MKVRQLLSLAAAAGLAIPAAASAAQPAPLPLAAANSNQQLADSVASRLRGLDVTGAQVNISAQDGVVTLSGTVRSAAQKDAIIAAARVAPGVGLVRDSLEAPASDVIQIGQPAAPVAPTPLPPSQGPVVEPAPLGVPGAITPDMQAPPLPPHAWPTYAPHNNLSRVGYPQAYPYNAFPFIGPYYPFPKVPLGWRKVTLEWEDGHWYLGRNSAPHDYWRVKFQ
ncbi:MAG: BON domain-containing protein [Gemmataceae bacterium]